MIEVVLLNHLTDTQNSIANAPALPIHGGTDVRNP